jgi:hypothetical protein
MEKISKFIVIAIIWSVSFMSTAQGSQEEKAFDVAKEYVLKELKWNCGEFIIELDDFALGEINAEAIILRATYKSDNSTTIPGAGKSIQIHVDKSSMKIIKTLGYQ